MSVSAPENTQRRAPARRGSVLRRNLTYCTGEGLVAMPIVFLTLPGNFIIAALLTKTFSVGETLFGVIASLPHWCNVVQLLVMPLLTRRWPQKHIALAFSWMHLSVWIALAILLPHVPRDDMARAGTLFFAIFALSALSHAMVGVAWTSWVQEWVPERLRQRYFGRRNRLLQFSTVVFLLLAGHTITRWNAVGSLAGYQIVILVGVALRALSITAQYRILSTSRTPAHETGMGLRAQLRLIADSRPLMRYYAFGAAFGLLMNLFGPFFNVYMYDGLGMTVAQVTMLLVISNITGALALPAWGQLLDRYGNRPVMAFALIMWTLPGFAWAFLHPHNTWLLGILYASGGLFQAGFVLGQFNFLLKLVPPAAKTAAISLNVALTSLATAVAPIVGGIALDHALRAGFETLTVYHAMSVAHHGLVLFAPLALLGVAEPKAVALSQVVGAMRSSRQLVALMGMSFLVNYVFTRAPRRKRPASSRGTAAQRGSEHPMREPPRS